MLYVNIATYERKHKNSEKKIKKIKSVIIVEKIICMTSI
jgi:hypothetical protein